MADRYTVELGDFFDQADAVGGPQVTTVISNPPYIPAPDRDILMPELWGGVRGNDLVLQLLKAGYDNVVTAVASYSDPETTVRTAQDLGYRVVNFLAMGLDYGTYSGEPKVRDHIRRLCDEGHGWAGDDEYMVAVALFTRNPDIPGDRADQLLKALQSDCQPRRTPRRQEPSARRALSAARGFLEERHRAPLVRTPRRAARPAGTLRAPRPHLLLA